MRTYVYDALEKIRLQLYGCSFIRSFQSLYRLQLHPAISVTQEHSPNSHAVKRPEDGEYALE